MEVSFVFVQDYDVIAVPDVVFDVVLVLHVLIEFVHVEIAEPLRCVVSDWDVVAASETVDDVMQEPERVFALDLLLYDVKHQIVVYGWVELSYIHLQTVSVFGFPDELHCSSAACVDAFSGSAGIAIMDH